MQNVKMKKAPAKKLTNPYDEGFTSILSAIVPIEHGTSVRDAISLLTALMPTLEGLERGSGPVVIELRYE